MSTEDKTTKKKGFKPTLRDMQRGEVIIFPRTAYGTLRNTISIMKVEYPEKEFLLLVVPNGIEVTCYK